ncbi:copper-exporting ATPase [Bifidobacterium gallicum]|uniref:Copper-exporting ATPase n=1 Tax=Bifidobacterium gallicum DSM 20093 = LMG 11596 TaxID=561180 RepID=D1NWZ1_9BIFI|nr:copper-exporting ATPase [Bifidobacterium gallicum]EFA22122.1 hypothetical protein BIFGAL_04398 [Bifidobacterium gallicum DSM 20093 = LMG 11596]KFI59016.1 copper-exporting ATPase [Bifidobacterium gallicum DSM 20093 = LMG 11596]
MTLNLFASAVLMLLAVITSIGTVRSMASHTAGALTDQHMGTSSSPTDTLIRRTIVAAALTLVTLAVSGLHLFITHLPGWLADEWLRALLITPVMFYSAYAIHINGWQALIQRRPNLQSLVSLCTIAAYAYSLIVCCVGDQLPEPLQSTYFEFVGVTITLVLSAVLMERAWLPAKGTPQLQRTVNRISRVLVPIVLLIAMWTFVVWEVFGPQPALVRALVTAISVLAVSCPCALAWACPLPVSIALGMMQRHGMQPELPSHPDSSQPTSSQPASAQPTCDLERLTHRVRITVRVNIALVLMFNIVAIPIAAGVLYPWLGWMFNPMLASIAMIAPCVAVALCSLTVRLFRFTPQQ